MIALKDMKEGMLLRGTRDTDWVCENGRYKVIKIDRDTNDAYILDLTPELQRHYHWKDCHELRRQLLGGQAYSYHLTWFGNEAVAPYSDNLVCAEVIDV